MGKKKEIGMGVCGIFFYFLCWLIENLEKRRGFNGVMGF